MPEDDKKLVIAMQKAAEKELKIKAAKQVYTHYHYFSIIPNHRCSLTAVQLPCEFDDY
jgi:hypothetical protein